MDLTSSSAPRLQWFPPPDDECHETPSYRLPLDGADRLADEAHVVMTLAVATDELVGFVIYQRAKVDGAWRVVCTFDTDHEVVHRHQHGRASNWRIGKEDNLWALTSQASVDDGYTKACDLVHDNWRDYRRRWESA